MTNELKALIASACMPGNALYRVESEDENTTPPPPEIVALVNRVASTCCLCGAALHVTRFVEYVFDGANVGDADVECTRCSWCFDIEFERDGSSWKMAGDYE